MNERELTFEQRKRRFYERLESGYYIRPAPTPVLTVPVSKHLAEAVEANPGSVRVSARGRDGRHRVEGPQANPQHVTVRVDLVREVDQHGRPVYDRGGVVSDYNPLDALRRD
jgi:hypothetical protein